MLILVLDFGVRDVVATDVGVGEGVKCRCGY